ncbi:hypothetical protein QLS91_15825 [Flavobacterium sp. LB2P84]|jgi:hypothetical protein|uniref:DUF6770 family protein n=1 Tax=Flavobacterium TaxID=237 RepID=UPI0024A82E17|nr:MULTISPECIES: DUF6770 family protein [Flavobacterium]MDI6034549.1 hypothetical protein [Flavobacterium yafengii]MDI6050475.1 hypothetical protein [Flavobacterium sp. XS2P24]
MKRISTLLLISFVANLTFAQEKKINEVNTFKVKNSGAILNKEKDVDGYYFFYELDKLKKGDREFAIQVLDKNLVEVAKKTYIDNKNTFLMKSSFNNQGIMFAMANFKEKKISLLSYDKKVNQLPTIDIPLESKEIRYIQYMQQTGDFNIIFPVENKGFIFNKFEDNKKIGYSLKYYPTDGGKSWEYNSPDDSKEMLAINPIEVNDKVIVALETSKPGLLSRKLTLKTKIIDVNTGVLLYEKEYSKNSKPRLINNAFLDKDNNVVLMGEYFKEGDNIIDDKSLGLFTEVVDLSGKTLKENFTSWKEDVAKIAKVSGNYIEDKGYIYFHNIARTKNNEYYAIGEFYKRTASAGGIALTTLSILGGGGGGASVTQLTITNSVVFKFNSDFKLTGIQEFEKGKSRAPSLSDFGSPQLNAHALKAYGAFDYEYTQLDKTNDRFYACFIDYERLKGEKNKSAFKTIICDNGQLSEDKIYLKSDNNNTDFRVLPAKVGNVLLLEYDKKLKEINIHLEKINIK